MAGDKEEDEPQTPSACAYRGSFRTRSLQRDQLITQICSTKTNINDLLQLSKYQLEVKLSLLERQLKSFETIQSELESLDESEISQNHRCTFEEAYYEIKSVILERLASLHGPLNESPLSSTRVSHQTSISQRPQLPTLQLSKFNGNYRDWMEFYNVFCLLVHENQELSPVSKFQYLKSCLTDSAARLIQSLEVTAQNYEVAFDLLKTRYNNKNYLFQSHLLQIFNIQKLYKPNITSLRLFIDTINASLRALDSIASKQQISDGIIMHLIVSKLDPNLQAKWEDNLAAFGSGTATLLQLPSWDDLAKFLERRCKSLEIHETNHSFSSREQSKTYSQPNRNNRTSSFNHHTTAFVSLNQATKCIICDSAPNHSVFRCTKFIDMSVTDRFREAKRLKLCLNCLGTSHIAKSCPSLNKCQKCKATHHTLLHKEPASTSAPNIGILTSPQSDNTTVDETDLTPTACLHAFKDRDLAILATAMIELYSPSGVSIIGRALLDSCSQSNFITERMAQHLHLPRKKINMGISGIGGSKSVIANYSCIVRAKSLTSEFSPTFNAVIIPSISSNHPHQHLNTNSWNIPQNIKLADETFNVPGPVDLLIGVEIFWDLLMVGKIKMANQINLMKTKLGWIVSGLVSIPNSKSNPISTENSKDEKSEPQQIVSMAATKMDDCDVTNVLPMQPSVKYNRFIVPSNKPTLDKLLESFWRVEDCEPKQREIMSAEEKACEKFFLETVKRCPITNKFIVRLPFHMFPPDLGESRSTALRRFTYLESRFARDKGIQKEYIEFMEEYISLNHMAPIKIDNARYFIPHHCVIKSDSTTTRLRVVFDASCVTNNGKSLNDMLKVGPNLQEDIFTILCRFRYHKYAMSADIAKMYRQVLVDETDSYWQCILWRKHVNDPIQSYKLQTVTYGTSSASYLAIKCLQQIAIEEKDNYPIGAKVTLNDFYVDNLMTGGSTEEEVIEIKRQVTALLACGGFPLRKFVSNSEALLRDVPTSDRETLVELKGIHYVKALGLKWSPTEDIFSFSYPAQQSKLSTTKRSILSHMASFFDPLGFINPIIVRCKILMQELWKLKLHWDESVPHDVFFEWKQIRNELNLISEIKIPRYVKFFANTIIHVFVDASKRAYGACIYAVSTDGTKSSSRLLCAKSKVAPTKEISLPRLELCAALLGSKLLQSTRNSSPNIPQQIVCWSDSKISLCWIAGEPCRWPTFVANRVTKIQNLTNDCTWRHVPSELNPADLLSRGTTTSTLSKPFWLNGPDFLLKKERWPEQDQSFDFAPCVETQFSLLAEIDGDIISNHKYVNRYEKLLRIFSYVLRFIKLSKRQEVYQGPIHAEEMQATLLVICQIIQNTSFSDEIKQLRHNKPLSTNSRLLQLSPFIHEGLLRVGGRLKNSSLPFSTKHPILLPSNHLFVKTIVNYFHIKNLHAGSLTLHNVLRDQFWIINGRNVIKKIIHKCILCYRCRPVTEAQIMGALPAHRIEQTFPFFISGIDYCGPFQITSRIRGRSPSKVYLAVFICFSVKAVHLELVPDLTTSAFIMALKRFISRRGRCSVIYSDNATNFIGANRELQNLLQHFLSESHNEEVRNVCRQEGIMWKFIPPRSPHFGGLWESAVKQAKHFIRRAVGNHILTYDELHTVCCQTEAIINSRPLTPFSSDPNDLRALTPAHFLVGRLLTAVPEPTVLATNPMLLKRYQLVQWVQQHFWERWRNEYIKLLQIKTKWSATRHNLKVNDLVLLKEDNIPPLKWPIGRVIECHPGNDGMVRVATIRTAEGVFKRAITKICKLPIYDV